MPGEEKEHKESSAAAPTSLEDRIKAHNESSASPEVHEAKIITDKPAADEGEKKEEKKETRSEFKKHFLSKGFLSGLLLNILVTAFSWGNAMVYNLLMSERKIEEWRKLKPEPGTDEEDEIGELIDLYAPKIMDILDGLPDEVLMLCFIEYGFITRMHLASVPVKPKEEKKLEEVKNEATVKEEKSEKVPDPPKPEEKPKETIKVEGHKLIFVITREEKPQYWKEDKIYVDRPEDAFHFNTGEQAVLGKNDTETITTWKIKK